MTEHTALVFEEQEYSAERLDGLAAGLAGVLARRGVRAGERVALMSSNRPEFVVAVQAIWRLGAAVVLMSPAWKQAEAEHALAITDPAHAVGDHPVLGGLMPMLHLDEPIAPADTFHPPAAGRAPPRRRPPPPPGRPIPPPTRCWCSVRARPACPRRSGTPTPACARR